MTSLTHPTWARWLHRPFTPQLPCPPLEARDFQPLPMCPDASQVKNLFCLKQLCREEQDWQQLPPWPQTNLGKESKPQQWYQGSCMAGRIQNPIFFSKWKSCCVALRMPLLNNLRSISDQINFKLWTWFFEQILSLSLFFLKFHISPTKGCLLACN